MTPFQRWSGGGALGPDGVPRVPVRVLRKVKPSGVVQVNRWLIARGVEFAGQPAEVHLDGLRVAAFVDGPLIRDLELDLCRRYQSSGGRRGPKPKDGT